MKKFIMLIACAVSISLLGGCTSKTEIETVHFNEDAMLTLARAQADELIAGNADKVIAAFDEKMAKAGLDAATLNMMVQNLTTGEYVGFYTADGIVANEFYIAEVIYEYEHNGFKVTLVYNGANEISGLNLNYASIDKPLAADASFEEIAVTIGDLMPLDGVLTLPTDVTNPPVVLLVHGSGPADKNATIAANAPFQDIAHGLANLGIATLRYDKRTYAYPKEMAELGAQLTIQHEVLNDVDAAIDLLLTESQKTNPRAIFVLGHSMGGGLTPAIAVANPEISGIISMAGILDPLFEASYAQNKDIERVAQQGGFDDATTTLVVEQMIKVEEDIAILRSDMSDIPDDQILMGLPAGYQKSTKEFAGINFISDIEVPVLVLQGAKDFQVKATTDYAAWQETLAEYPMATFKLYENLNHLMMPSNGAGDISEYQEKGVVSEDVISDIATFVNSNA